MVSASFQWDYFSLETYQLWCVALSYYMPSGYAITIWGYTNSVVSFLLQHTLRGGKTVPCMMAKAQALDHI